MICIFLSEIHKMKVVKIMNILLVSENHPLNQNIQIPLKTISKNLQIHEMIYDDLFHMLNEMIKAGLKPVICSAYRSFQRQKELYEKKCQYYQNKRYSFDIAQKLASQWVAKPGCSEHQTGLALDIVSVDYQQLDEKQEQTQEQQWLMLNSWRYGFILLYPKGKQSITHVNYEPWHYRYVGKIAATEIYNRQITFEEYVEH